MELPVSFIHHPPENCNYEVNQFRVHIISIWLCDYSEFNYTQRSPIKTIWGFYNTRKEQYYSPINSTKQGDPVDIHTTTPSTAMVIKRNPLEMLLYV